MEEVNGQSVQNNGHEIN